MRKTASVPSLVVDGELARTEADLARAEAEVALLEERQAEAAQHAAREAQALAQRLGALRAQLAQAQLEGSGDEEVRALLARLHAGAAPGVPGLLALRRAALEARAQALEARRQAAGEVPQALQAFQEEAARLGRDAHEAEGALRRAAQQRAAAAAARAAAQRATAEAARRAAQAARRRERSRVAMQASVDLHSDSNFYTGFSADVREGGLFVATVQVLPRGTPVDLTFTLPGGGALQASGVVSWTREVNDGRPEMMPGVGVQFSALPPEVAHAIGGFTAQREPLFIPV